MLNGVLVTFLADNRVFNWGPVEIGWLMGIPVLTGSLFRLPAGILTDKYGGKPVFGTLLILCALPMFLLSYANSFLTFALCGFGFGLTGVSFAIGIAFTSVWYPKKRQGTALGIFGAGNAGAALTTLIAPSLLKNLTNGATNVEGWRTLPIIYAVALLITGILFLLFTVNKKPESSARTLRGQLQPLKNIRVWRFGIYYFLVFGCFVAFSQWLVPYFVNVYSLSLITAGLFAALFSFPSGVIRALGGWMSDKYGARRVMYWVLGSSTIISLFLIVPRMEIISPGRGVMAKRGGVITAVSDSAIIIDEKLPSGKTETQNLPLKRKVVSDKPIDNNALIFPTKEGWQEPMVAAGDAVEKKQLLAKGVTRIFFQANVWVFAVLVILIGSIWGIGKAAVYKHIPDYFPEEVGVVGGMVGVLGGLGGFVGPVVFGYLLEWTGLWTSCWMFMFFLSILCLFWMHRVIQKMMRQEAPELSRQIEEKL